MTEPAYVSWQTVAWVLDDAPGLPPRLVGTLVGLARHADGDGRGAYPSRERLAGYTRKSDTQIKRDLKDLQALGLIRPGDQGLASHLRADRRPTVYDLAIERKRGAVDDPSSTTPRQLQERQALADRKQRLQERGAVYVDHGGPSTPARGAVQVQHGGSSTAPEETLKRTEETIEETFCAPLRESPARNRKTDVDALLADLRQRRGVPSVYSVPDKPPPAPSKLGPHPFINDGAGYCTACLLPKANQSSHPRERAA